MPTKPSYSELERKLADLEGELVESRRAKAGLENELRQFRGLYDLATALTTGEGLDAYLRLVVDKARDLLHTDLSYIALYDESQDDFYKHTMSGIQTQAFKDVRRPADRGLGGLVSRTRQGCIVEDYRTDERLDRRNESAIVEEGIVSGMAVPLRMGVKNLGVLYVFNRTKTTFTSSDLATLSLIGNLAATEISRKQGEELMRQSEERFRFMVKTTGDVLYRLHYDAMTYDYLSPGIKNLTGYSSEELKDIGFSRLVTRIDLPGREDVPPHIIVRDRVEGKPAEFRADYSIVTKGGDSKWVRDHSFPWLDERGKLVGSVGILSDVTDYKRAETLVRQRTEDLVESEEKYRTLVENVPLVVYRVGATGEVLFINQFVEELLGYGPVEVLRSPSLWSRAVYDEDRDRVTELRRKAQKDGEELLTEYRLMHKDGSLVYVVDHAMPLRTPEGLVANVDGIIMDVTGRVKLQEQLIQTEAIKTIGEVSARLAHEIRNPLMCAGGFARRILTSMGPGDPNRDKVEIIVKEVGRLESILRMILNTIQPVQLDVEPMDANALIETALKAVETEGKNKKQTLRTDLPSGLPRISVDPARMEQALKTLLSNALSQMPPDATLSVSTTLEKGWLHLALRYPVQHLSSDDVEHFFYPFTTFNADSRATDLPMAKVLVHKHGGMIDVKLARPGEILIRILLPV